MTHGLKIIDNYSLKNYNTFGIDCKADQFIKLTTLEEVTSFVTNYDVNEPTLIIGGGSNILLLNDFKGLVIHVATKGMNKVEETKTEIILECSSGEVWEDVVSYCVENNYYGIENLTLIPGTIGASPIQNIGAYGVEIKDVLESVDGYDLVSKEFKTYSNQECQFNYRSSIFKNKLKGNFLITKVRIKLSKLKKFQLNYRSLSEKFGKLSVEEIDIKEVSSYVKNIRLEKLPDHTILGNAGSFFKNPEVDAEKLEYLQKQFKGIISFATANGLNKIAAGWLIEDCGFKGKRIGNVSCFEKQALVIVNHGNASGREILEYSELIQTAVMKKFGIYLLPEVNII